MKQWQQLSEKFLQLTIREQFLVLLTGLIAIVFVSYYFLIDKNAIENNSFEKKIVQLTRSNKSQQAVIQTYQEALLLDPNVEIRQKIALFESKLAKIDANLLTLTSDLVDPIQMRFALLELLKVEQGVALLSFELVGAQPLLSNVKSNVKPDENSTVKSTDEATIKESSEKPSLNLYRHGIKIKLAGSYFDLRDYLLQLEQLSWKFFWQDFNFKVTTYPENELEIEMYSLSTKREFVGV